MHVSLNTTVRNRTKSQQMSHFVKYFSEKMLDAKMCVATHVPARASSAFTLGFAPSTTSQ